MDRVHTAAAVLFTRVICMVVIRIIKSVVTAQAPVTLELRNTRGKKHKQIQGVRCMQVGIWDMLIHRVENYLGIKSRTHTYCNA